MSPSSLEEKYREEWARTTGDMVHEFALGRVLAGPTSGTGSVFVVVGESACHLISASGPANVFGIPLPGQDEAESLPPVRLERGSVVALSEEPSGWRRLWAPRNVLLLRVDGQTPWLIQLVPPIPEFLARWKRHWPEWGVPGTITTSG